MSPRCYSNIFSGINTSIKGPELVLTKVEVRLLTTPFWRNQQTSLKSGSYFISFSCRAHLAPRHLSCVYHPVHSAQYLLKSRFRLSRLIDKELRLTYQNRIGGLQIQTPIPTVPFPKWDETGSSTSKQKDCSQDSK